MGFNNSARWKRGAAAAGGMLAALWLISFARAQNAAQVNLPNGWNIMPAGKVVPLAGDMPLRIALTPAGDRGLVLTGGFHDHSLALVDLKQGRIVQTMELAKD